MSKYLTADEERDLVLRGQAGDVEARNRVIMNCNKMIWVMAHRYAGRNRENAETYHAEAVATLCEKFHLFDLAMDCKFLTWATFWIRQAITRYIMEKVHKGIRVPICARDQVRRDPGDPRAVYVERAKRISSADAVVAGTEDLTNTSMFIDHREKPPDDWALREDRVQLVRAVLPRLQPRYREILQLRASGLTLDETGKELGVSRERIRQLETMAQEKFLKEAERLAAPVVEELESDIRDANRHWAGRLLNKGGRQMDEVTAEVVKPPAKERIPLIAEILKELGPGTSYRRVDDVVFERHGYHVCDPDIAAGKRLAFGESAISKERSNVGKMGAAAKVNGHVHRVKEAPPRLISLPAPAGLAFTLEDLRKVKAYAESMGGMGRLLDACQFLRELQVSCA